jgi:hypothetical protein
MFFLLFRGRKEGFGANTGESNVLIDILLRYLW